MIHQYRIFYLLMIHRKSKEITIDFFDNFIKKGIYNPFVSEVVIAEIEDTKDQKKRNKLIKVNGS